MKKILHQSNRKMQLLLIHRKFAINITDINLSQFPRKKECITMHLEKPHKLTSHVTFLFLDKLAAVAQV